jgi:hypothetical protein
MLPLCFQLKFCLLFLLLSPPPPLFNLGLRTSQFPALLSDPSLEMFKCLYFLLSRSIPFFPIFFCISFFLFPPHPPSLDYFPYFVKTKGWIMRALCCLYVCVSPPSTFGCLNLFLWNLASEPISKEYFINPSRQSVRLYLYPSIVARQRLSKNVNAATNTHATIKELFDASFLCGPCHIKGK